jgi:peptidoglycan/LPS O-acetylase OafA/YrhL
MLHGAVSSSVLFESQLMFLSTGWSLSLEWQFYLVAPLIIASLRSRRGIALLIVVTLAVALAYRAGWFGVFALPSFLPGAAHYFALGIATRMFIFKLPRPSRFPIVGALIAIGLCLVTDRVVPVAIWAIFVAWMLVQHPADAWTRAVDRTFSALFDSRAANYVGELSYSIYLVHLPILYALMYACVRGFELGPQPTFFIALLLTPPLTLLASALLHRYVEAPAIAYGRTLFKSAPRPAAVAAQTVG